MIVTKENGTIYTNGLTIEVINWHKEVGYIIADIKRPLTKNKEGEYVDDITDEEIEAGYEAVRGFLYREIADPLFFKVQRGEIEESEWLAAIQEIKDTYKYIGGNLMANSNTLEAHHILPYASNEYIRKSIYMERRTI